MVEYLLDEYLEFSFGTQAPTTGAATDADALPTYRIYEENNDVAVDTGNCAKRDDAGTLGYYFARAQITAGAGYEVGKDYYVEAIAIVGGVTSPPVPIGMFRVVSADVVRDDVWTDARAGYLDRLDIAISAVAASVWDYSTALCVTVGSIGLMIVDYLGTFVAIAPVADGEDTVREDFDQLPFRRDLEILQGRTWEESFKVRICLHGGDAELINFTEATSGTLRFKASDGTITAEIALHELAIAGNITARLTIAQTTALEAGRQHWEMYFKFPVASTQFPDGEEFSLFSGWAVVKASIPAV